MTSAIELYDWLRTASYDEIAELRKRSGLAQLSALQLVALHCDRDAWVAFIGRRTIGLAVTALDRNLLAQAGLLRSQP